MLWFLVFKYSFLFNECPVIFQSVEFTRYTQTHTHTQACRDLLDVEGTSFDSRWLSTLFRSLFSGLVSTSADLFSALFSTSLFAALLRAFRSISWSLESESTVCGFSRQIKHQALALRAFISADAHELIAPRFRRKCNPEKKKSNVTHKKNHVAYKWERIVFFIVEKESRALLSEVCYGDRYNTRVLSDKHLR